MVRKGKKRRFSLISPNPPIDGVRTAEGGGSYRGDGLGSIGMHWRSADGLQSPDWVPMAVCGSCAARDGWRVRSRELPWTGVVRVFADVGSVAGRPSGREWNGSQPGQGATDLGFPRPALWQMQGEAACRVGEPSGQGEDPSSEGLGGRGPLSQTSPRRPAGQVMRHAPGSPARRRWRRSAPRACGSARRRT